MPIALYNYTAIFTPAEEGFIVAVPLVLGCVSVGNSFEQARDNIREAIELYFETLLSEGQNPPIERLHPLASTIDVHVTGA